MSGQVETVATAQQPKNGEDTKSTENIIHQQNEKQTNERKENRGHDLWCQKELMQLNVRERGKKQKRKNASSISWQKQGSLAMHRQLRLLQLRVELELELVQGVRLEGIWGVIHTLQVHMLPQGIPHHSSVSATYTFGS